MRNLSHKLKLIIFLTSLFVFTSATSNSNIVKAESEIYFFYGDGCPHCTEVHNYFDEQNIYNRYPIDQREIYFNRDNALLFTELMSNLGIAPQKSGVPTAVIGNKALIGSLPIIENFEIEADKYLNDEIQKPKAVEEKSTINLTLPAVIAASIVDAINPCAFAVLILLMSTILIGGNPQKALKTGLAFASSIFISYFLMGLGLYKALSLGEVSGIFFKIVGWLAIILGLFNLKDWLWYGKGFLLEVPMSWRPKLKRLIQAVTSPKGAFGIGFVISLFLLPCTSGPYIVILGMLADKVLQSKALLYLFIYNLIFVSPMLLITWAVYKGFDPAKAEKMRQKQLKTLHLIAGIIMIIMGIVVLSGWI
ncbi:hypothetical protein HN803_08180 [candidate division WWE3 bacterium]|jgi:cytochrome c biogenesis protein CcdA|nr:hypothetical protein [candidate division WWE3 bacterium]MBT7350729.1 hypothetical protein [candidate division WWE3 bacterium]